MVHCQAEARIVSFVSFSLVVVRVGCCKRHVTHSVPQMNAVKEGMCDYLRAVQEVRRNSAWGEHDVAEALVKAEQVFGETLTEQARQVAWLSVVVFSKVRRKRYSRIATNSSRHGTLYETNKE